MELLPSIDLRRGRVVRLVEGDDERPTVYEETPAAVLARYAAAGIERVHVVDLDAAFGEPPQRALIAELVASGAAAIQLGGGLRDAAAVRSALDLGCERLVLGSMVARAPEEFAGLARRFPGRLVPALEFHGSRLRLAGWRETARLDAAAICATLRGLPCPAVLVTDIARDGTLAGPNLDLASAVARATQLRAVVSGGVRALADLAAAAARQEIAAAVVGRALYERRFSVAAAVAVAGPSRLAKRVVPCLDVAGGRVVKGVRFENLRDQGDPRAAAARYADQGADEIVFLDITAAPERRSTDLAWVEQTAAAVSIPLTVGGGVRDLASARALLNAGADKIAVNTAAVARPDLISELAQQFGSQCVVLSVDARLRQSAAAVGETPRSTSWLPSPWGRGAGGAPHGGEGEHLGSGESFGAEPTGWDALGGSPFGRDAQSISSWEVLTQGGRHPTGLDALEWIRAGVAAGAGEVLLTSIDSDGTQAGYDLDLLGAAVRAVAVPVIASGGAGTLQHLASAFAAGAAAVIAASIFHERRWTVGEAKAFLAERGFPVRKEWV